MELVICSLHPSEAEGSLSRGQIDAVLASVPTAYDSSALPHTPTLSCSAV